jgi:hypothetical protein
MSTGALPTATICPACLEQYPPGSIPVDASCCPECYSEAREIDVVSYKEFLDRISVQRLEEMRSRWSTKTGLLPQFKALVATRIEDLIRAKHAP